MRNDMERNMGRNMMQGWEVTYAECKKTKWPYLIEKPINYVCVLCRGGVSVGRRESGRKGGAARVARRKQEQGL